MTYNRAKSETVREWFRTNGMGREGRVLSSIMKK